MGELRADLELGKLIDRQAEKNGAAEREALWAASVRAYHARRGEDLRLAWYEHEMKMCNLHAALSAEHQERAERLAVNGHDKESE